MDTYGLVGAVAGVIGFIAGAASWSMYQRTERQRGHRLETARQDLGALLKQELQQKSEPHTTIQMRLGYATSSRFGIASDEYKGAREQLEVITGPPVYEDNRDAPTITPTRIYALVGVAVILTETKPLKIRGATTRAEAVARILGTYLHLRRMQTSQGPTEADRQAYDGMEFYEAPGEAGEETKGVLEEPAPTIVQQ